MIEKITDERLLDIVTACAPLQVNISLHKEGETMVVYFDGRNTYPDSETWLGTWGGFETYVKLLLFTQKIKYVNLTKIENGYVSVNLGTLFDMIKMA